MKFLIDNALSPVVARALASAGHNAVHVRDRQLATAPDDVLFDLAAHERRVLVSADTDFATLLALRQATQPSVILFRHSAPRHPDLIAELLMEHLDEWREALDRGSLVTIDHARARVRPLPILRR